MKSWPGQADERQWKTINTQKYNGKLQVLSKHGKKTYTRDTDGM